MIYGKIWGTTQCIFKNENFEVHRIFIKKGGYCSKHKHIYKYNMFFVETGHMDVKVWKNDYDLCDVTAVYSSYSTIVKPGEFHQFVGIIDTVAYEIYWTHAISSDIIREISGGMLQ